MKEGQEHIYYMPATSWEEAVKSPYLEAFRAQGLRGAHHARRGRRPRDERFTYKGKQRQVHSSGRRRSRQVAERGKGRSQKKYQKLIDLIKEQLADQVKDVRLSGRLKDSACLLVADEGDLNPQMEKILKAMGQDVPENKRILEINPDHPLFAAMNSLFEKDKESRSSKNMPASCTTRRSFSKGRGRRTRRHSRRRWPA